MKIKPIKTEKDYKNSLKRIEELWGAKKNMALMLLHGKKLAQK